MVRHGQVARAGLVIVVTLVILSLIVYITLGTQWGFETYLFPYVIAASTLPLIATLITRRYRLVVPSLLLMGGVTVFFWGITPVACRQPATDAWGFAYDLQQNLIRFGPKRGGQLACQAEPSLLGVIPGWALTSLGALQLLDGTTSWEWLPLNLHALS
ncbi:MAG: hypothetical protein V5A23_02445 [Halobacteriales archaeon]